MNHHQTSLRQVCFWGAVTSLLYFALFYYAELILNLAHKTPAHCMVGQVPEISYFHKMDAAECAARGGVFEAANWYYVLVPISIAFAISYAHGTFTGAFWDYMGLKPATSRQNK